MVGFMNLKARSISSAFSSLAHLCRLRVMKTMSFCSQPLSATSVSKTGLFRSRLRASAMRCSLSLMLAGVNRAVNRQKQTVEYSRPVELAELDQAELEVARLLLGEGALELGDARLDLVGGGEVDARDVGGHHDAVWGEC